MISKRNGLLSIRGIASINVIIIIIIISARSAALNAYTPSLFSSNRELNDPNADVATAVVKMPKELIANHSVVEIYKF